MAMQEKINEAGRNYIAGLRATVAACWKKACEFDKIPTDTAFAVFSKENPYEPFYQKAMSEYLAAMREYAAGGYVGLMMDRKRARFA